MKVFDYTFLLFMIEKIRLHAYQECNCIWIGKGDDYKPMWKCFN